MNADVVVVGAGIAGLMAARVIQKSGLSVTVLDKGRSVGGRLATRRIGAGVADHGAQFFTARTDEFREIVMQWVDEGVVYEWSRGWSDGSLKRVPGDGFPRYAVQGGMNQLAKYLAVGLPDVQVNVRVLGLSAPDGIWALRAEHDQVFSGRAALLTPPAPQTLELLNTSHIPLVDTDRMVLERIHFGPCLCGLFVVEGEVDLPEPGARQTPDGMITWIADNQRKGISPEARVITIHSGVIFSRQYWEVDDAIILDMLRQELEALFAAGTRVVAAQLKRWRYSVPLTTEPESHLLLKGLPPLAVAGDAFGGRGRVEGATLSGLAAGRALLEALGQ